MSVDDALHAVVRVQSYVKKYDIMLPHVDTASATATGSGFFVSQSRRGRRMVLTAAHVVRNAYSVTCILPLSGGDEIPAHVVAVLPELDMALLRLELPAELDRSVRPLRLGDSDSVRPGDPLFAYGYPLSQMSVKVTDGVYSGIENGKLQHSVPISPGNSGGPLVDRHGDVVGVNIQLIVKGVNTALASPINLLYFAIDDVRARLPADGKTGVWTRPTFGIQLLPTTESTVLSLTGSKGCCKSGVYARKVLPGSPAERAGLRDGDVVCAIDGLPISGKGVVKVDWYPQPVPVNEILFRHLNPARPLRLTVHGSDSRACREISLRPSSLWHRGVGTVVDMPYSGTEYIAVGGIVVAPLVLHRYNEVTLELLPERERHKDWLVVVDVVPGSQAASYHAFEPGEVLDTCCGITVRTLHGYELALRKAKETIQWTGLSGSTFALTVKDARAFDLGPATQRRLYHVDPSLYARS